MRNEGKEARRDVSSGLERSGTARFSAVHCHPPRTTSVPLLPAQRWILKSSPKPNDKPVRLSCVADGEMDPDAPRKDEPLLPEPTNVEGVLISRKGSDGALERPPCAGR